MKPPLPVRPLRAALLAAALVLLPAAAPAADALEAAAKKEITAAEAQKAGMILAGPRFLGRGNGQKGNEDAARWLASQLLAAGLEPGAAPPSGTDGKPAEADFLQWFEVPPRPGQDAPFRAANVVGIVRGSGPGGEAVVVGGHFDHLGVRGGDPKPGKKPPKRSGVFWGADDNASGTAGTLLVARALGRAARDGRRPRRSVVVVFFTGEELGLLGSRHYVSAPAIPVAETVTMINLDMIGRNATKAVEVYGHTSSPELDAWHRRVLEDTKLDCSYPSPALLQRSDQWPFYEAKVPVLFLHGGLEKDYHTPRDVPEELNWAKIALVSRHALGVLWLAADAEKRPSFREVDMKDAGGKLGVAVDPCTPEEEEALNLDEKHSAVRVSTVFAGSLGERFFQVGDLIYSWNGASLPAEDPAGRFTSLAEAARQGDQVVLRLLRGKERKAVTVKL